MIGAALREEKESVGREVESAGFAVAFGELDEQAAGVLGAEAIDHTGDLASPGGVAFGALDELLHMAAASGEFAESFEVLRGQVGLRSAGVAAGGERDAAENAASIAGIGDAAKEKLKLVGVR